MSQQKNWQYSGSNTKYHTCDTLNGITHGFFTRNGGASIYPLNSLNFFAGNGESINNIRANRQTVLSCFAGKFTKLLTLKQVHSNRVRVIKNMADIWDTHTNEPPEADAIISNLPGILIGIKTADCVPILIVDKNNSIVAVIHAGWRGLLQEVIGQTITKMQIMTNQPLRACIGPCIHVASYEVNSDLYMQFINRNYAWDEFFQVLPRSTKILFDVQSLALRQLYDAGVVDVAIIDINTYENPGEFFSYRYCTHNNIAHGTQLSVIGIDEMKSE